MRSVLELGKVFRSFFFVTVLRYNCKRTATSPGLRTGRYLNGQATCEDS